MANAGQRELARAGAPADLVVGFEYEHRMRIVLGGLGIGPRGTTDLKCFLANPDVQFVAIFQATHALYTFWSQ